MEIAINVSRKPVRYVDFAHENSIIALGER